ncbi:hypothetical protein GCU60_15945 [Blastococcus saxobsidens]|uniref:Uncharacterized protein n=1 Tax=Blastococcus saxobsidens TaxID=138336 RepID=A0A6L9W762_9ACTN|nr:hypothetical protein [Blastococcus saxobsidens]NEK87234.1 hypothetical protein [Blastococcus saxobsidens]
MDGARGLAGDESNIRQLVQEIRDHPELKRIVVADLQSLTAPSDDDLFLADWVLLVLQVPVGVLTVTLARELEQLIEKARDRGPIEERPATPPLRPEHPDEGEP